jgi:hypothetical protein
MRVLLPSLLLVVSIAAQNPPALDPAKVFDYDASKPPYYGAATSYIVRTIYGEMPPGTALPEAET